MRGKRREDTPKAAAPLSANKEWWKAREAHRLQYALLGFVIMQKMFRVKGLGFSEQALEPVLEWFNCGTVEDLYVAVGQGLFTARFVFGAAFDEISKENVVVLREHPHKQEAWEKRLARRDNKSKSPDDNLPVEESISEPYHKTLLEAYQRVVLGLAVNASQEEVRDTLTRLGLPADAELEAILERVKARGGVAPEHGGGVGDDLNTAVKKARAKVFRRDASKQRLAAAAAAYKAMLKNIDLLNPRLSESERLTRARRLVRAYERLRKRKPAFEDHSKQLLAAFSIINKVKYRGAEAKKAALAM
jgi:hypothetical protein